MEAESSPNSSTISYLANNSFNIFNDFEHILKGWEMFKAKRFETTIASGNVFIDFFVSSSFLKRKAKGELICREIRSKAATRGSYTALKIKEKRSCTLPL